jgi:hypothetical protein
MSPIRLGFVVKQEVPEGLNTSSIKKGWNGAFSLPTGRVAHRFYFHQRTLPFSLSKEMIDDLG